MCFRLKRKQQREPPKLAPEPNKNYVHIDEGWAVVQAAFDNLSRFLEGKPTILLVTGSQKKLCTPEEYMAPYTAVYNMCTQKPPHDYAKDIYERYKKLFEDFCHIKVLPSLTEKDGECLLNEIAKRWMIHCILVRCFSRYCHYVDRYYVSRFSLPNLHDVGLKCFQELVYNEIKVRAKDGALMLILREREGEEINRRLLKALVNFFVESSVGSPENYSTDLEGPILVETAAYYSRMAAKHISMDSCPKYMLMAEQKLKLEQKRAATICLLADTQHKLLKGVRTKLLKDYEQRLLDNEHSGLRMLLQHGKVEDLKRMYTLFRKVSRGLEPITPIFTKYIVDGGEALIKQAQDNFGKKCNKESASLHEVIFIKKVIEFHNENLGYVKECFGSNSQFHGALKEGFEGFCHKTILGTSMSELLSIYADNILRKGGGFEKLSDEIVEEMLDKVVKLLVYISDKDLFVEFCRKKLSWRLLFDRSASDEYERCLLSKLKQNIGGQFTSKMEGMIKDFALAREFQAEFENFQSEECSGHNLGMDLSVTVLTTGFWPTYKISDIQIPSEMTRAMEAFKMFYNMKNKSRKLNWILSLGTCIMTGKFVPKPMELSVTTYQAVTLMLFNDSERLTFKEIVEQLNLPEDEVVRLLHSLSCAKYKILNKEPNTRNISKNDEFTFNSKFTDRARRIKVPHPPMDEKKKVIEDVDKDRRYAIYAAVVRIMKGRKVITYQQLLVECLQQLSHLFKPDVKLVKRRIEDLIERNYMERDANEANTFKYIA